MLVAFMAEPTGPTSRRQRILDGLAETERVRLDAETTQQRLLRELHEMGHKLQRISRAIPDDDQAEGQADVHGE